MSRKPGITLGTYGSQPLKRHLRISPTAIQTHMHLLATSGAGKSRFLAHLYVELITAGFTVWCIDPHADLTAQILGMLVERGFYSPQNARGDPFEQLVYIDLPGAEKRGLYLPFDVTKQPGTAHAIASNVRESFHRAWPTLAGGSAPMFDTIIQDGVHVLLKNGLPLTSLFRLITDRAWRDELLAQEDDPDIIDFWHNQFDRLSEKDRVDQAGAALRRAHLLTFSPALKYTLGQSENVLNFRELMDRGQSLLLNLALQDHEARRLFGCLVTVFSEMAALSRLELPPHQRGTSTFLMIDEFSEFTAQSEEALSRMLSQVRKAKMFLIASHQTWSQTSERLQGALQNVGIEWVGRLGRTDAEYTARMLAKVDPRTLRHDLDADGSESAGMAEQREAMIQDLMELRTGSAYVVVNNVPPHALPWRLFIKRPPRRVQKVKTPHVADATATDQVKEIEEQYLARYFTPQSDVEQVLWERRKPTEPEPPPFRRGRKTGA